MKQTPMIVLVLACTILAVGYADDDDVLMTSDSLSQVGYDVDDGVDEDDDDVECPCNEIPEYFAYIDDEITITACILSQSSGRTVFDALISDEGNILVEPGAGCLVRVRSTGEQLTRGPITAAEEAACSADLVEAAEEQDVVCQVI